ncbi:MAG: hypothetical protein ACM3Q2_17785, partial [Syntrophothermus sp.]
RMKRALGEYKIAGVLTNIAALRWVLKQPVFLDGTFDINFVEEYFMPLIPDKWKGENAVEYEEAVSILGAILKDGSNKLNPKEITCSGKNRWTEARYE